MVLAVGNIDFYPHFSGTFIISMIILIKALRVGIGYFDIGTWFYEKKLLFLRTANVPPGRSGMNGEESPPKL